MKHVCWQTRGTQNRPCALPVHFEILLKTLKEKKISHAPSSGARRSFDVFDAVFNQFGNHLGRLDRDHFRLRSPSLAHHPSTNVAR